MKTAVYQINSKYVHSSLAAWYLSAAICDMGYECTVLEGSINETDAVHLARAEESGASVFALSCYIWNIDIVLSLAAELKKNDPSRIIILGGPEVSPRAEQILREYGFVDYVISGEGEVPLSVLVRCLHQKDNIPENMGVTWRGHTSEPYQMNIDPPCPYTSEYLDRLNGRISYIETSRGCPYRCAYCLSCKGGVRFFDIDRAKKDILTLANSGSRTIKFVDRTFNADRKRARELFLFILDEREKGSIPDGVTFHFEIAGELVDRDTVGILESAPAGLFQFEIGVQSFNEKTLKAIHRYTDLDRLSEIIKELSSKGNIHIHTDLIAGLPYEDIESFRNSYDRLASLHPHKIQLGFLKLLYGTDMREDAERFPCEFDTSAPYKVRLTPWLSEEDMCELETAEKASDGILWSGRFTHTVEYLLSVTEHGNYSLALELGKEMYRDGTPALDDLFDRMYEYCSGMDGVSSSRLRDVMLRDRIEHNNSCVIPRKLRIYDERMRMISERIAEQYPLREGKRRCIGILYSEGKVIFADYRKKHPVTERYDVTEIDIGELI